MKMLLFCVYEPNVKIQCSHISLSLSGMTCGQVLLDEVLGEILFALSFFGLCDHYLVWKV